MSFPRCHVRCETPSQGGFKKTGSSGSHDLSSSCVPFLLTLNFPFHFRLSNTLFLSLFSVLCQKSAPLVPRHLYYIDRAVAKEATIASRFGLHTEASCKLVCAVETCIGMPMKMHTVYYLEVRPRLASRAFQLCNLLSRLSLRAFGSRRVYCTYLFPPQNDSLPLRARSGLAACP